MMQSERARAKRRGRLCLARRRWRSGRRAKTECE